MLEASIKHLDGVIIWSDKRDEHDKIVRWEDPRVQAMMQATREFVAAHADCVQLDGVARCANSACLYRI